MPTALPEPGDPEVLFIVDLSGFVFRAYHALPPLTRKSDGLPIGAVTVPEITVSIAAELIQTRRQNVPALVEGPIEIA